MTTLTIFDLDDTLFKSGAKVMVTRFGAVVKTLDASDYNNYQLNEHEEFDFSQFRSAAVFDSTSLPIKRMLTKAKRIIHNKRTSPDSRCIILTARADMDDRDAFLSSLSRHGINVQRIHVERSGNLPNGSVERKKVMVVERYLRSHPFRRVRMFDDSTKNLHELLSMTRNFPHVKFEAWHVLHDGTAVKYDRAHQAP